MKLTQENTTHLLSVIRATTKEDGVGEATPSGLAWRAGMGGVSVTIHNEGGGSRAQVSVGRSSALALAGLLGVISGSIMAGVPETLTLGVFIGSVAGGVGTALGVGAALTRSAKKSVARVMDTISHTMAEMGEWPGVPSGASEDSGSEDTPSAVSTEAVRKIERLKALEDSRGAVGPRVTFRRISYATFLGVSLVSLLPTALRFFPTDYPLPWIIVGGLGGLFARTVFWILRGIRERKRIDAEIEALKGPTQGPLGELTTETEAS
jgi:hypothetical protein